jgi:hypothetical protein
VVVDVEVELDDALAADVAELEVVVPDAEVVVVDAEVMAVWSADWSD